MARSHPLEKYRISDHGAHRRRQDTTTSEFCLHRKSYKIGEVHDGAATRTGWSRTERGTRSHRCDHCFWNDTASTSSTPQGMSTPIEVERSLRVLDGAVACFDGVQALSRSRKPFGVRPTNTAFRACASSTSSTGPAQTSNIAFVDHRSSGARPAVLYIPIGLEADLKALSIASKPFVSGRMKPCATSSMRKSQPISPPKPRNIAANGSSLPSSRR